MKIDKMVNKNFVHLVYLKSSLFKIQDTDDVLYLVSNVDFSLVPPSVDLHNSLNIPQTRQLRMIYR